ncbi:SMI1/KNR4 family protein [Aquimarina sp. MMG016]|uniref:SMI1/KNR4 family protein n=1 Tax=Aquimarina sp. MMG016 TaxID=2822690 RepID=UPI001B39EA2C|nr:SMI1/KNR4 family protein [Aquimarina sp. MMG016]MBQ4818616.1 SMI1/KNR4 family protein [Aquimarina sp. MMG016]
MKEFYLEFEAEEYGLTQDNYWEKVMKPSEIGEKDFKPIERRLNLSLPTPFKEFYKSYYSLEKDFDTGGLFIAGNRENSKLSSLSDYFFNIGLSSNILGLGLIPFGLYNDEWYICLDMNGDQNNPRIVLFEMSNCGAGKDAISHRPWFSNFNSFIRCITDYQENGNWDNFKELDPGNNYLTAYDYWKN